RVERGASRRVELRLSAQGPHVKARPWVARLVLWAAGACALLAAATFRVAEEGRAELAASDAAWAAGDALGAAVHARAAARAYVPFAPHVGEAYRRLRAVAHDCEGRGDVESALFAWRVALFFA